MSDSQEKKILMTLKKNIQESVFQKGISMAKLVRDIDMSEPGFYKMLEAGSMKVKTLVKISEVLHIPLVSLFEGAGKNSQYVSGDNNNTGINSSFNDNLETYKRDISHKDDLINELKKQIQDKERIIQLLEKR